MKSFSYVTPQTPESAVALVSDEGRFLAGGMDLLGEMKERLVEPAVLVNIKALPGTREIAAAPEVWRIGANVTLAELAAHPGLRRQFPAIAQAAEEVGSPQMRNVATLGGNLAQHSRCWYYRHRDARCRKKGGPNCFARRDQNKYHALFTGCMCVSPAVSNLAMALAALDARVRLLRGRKATTLTIAELYASAWRTPAAHNSLAPEDLILGIDLPVAAGQRSVYLQVAEKSDFDWALVSCAAAARVEGKTLRDARIVLGAVAPIPWTVDAANRLLDGQEWSDELAGRVAETLLRDATPLAHNGYKVPIAHALVRRALARLVAEDP
ncbi:MAG TPA: FAD binding domain-containing protein [Opitutaceae bacterium]